MHCLSKSCCRKKKTKPHHHHHDYLKFVKNYTKALEQFKCGRKLATETIGFGFANNQLTLGRAKGGGWMPPPQYGFS